MKQRREKVQTVRTGFWRSLRKKYLVPVKTIGTRLVIALLLATLSILAFVRSVIVKIFSYANLKEELRAALFIASLVLILEHYGLLESLQQDNLQLALPFLFTLPASITDEPVTGNLHPILIDDLTYEKRFRQEAPLNRSELTSIIASLLQQKPQVLVIDLDLSPGPADSKPDTSKTEVDIDRLLAEKRRTEEARLDSLLEEAARNAATQIVLITPQPVLDPELARTKADWMHKMCAANIRFGLPDIPVVSGVALTYDSRPAALAAEVHRALTGTSSPAAICAQRELLIRYTRKYGGASAAERPDTELLNYRFAQAIHPRDLTEACPADNCSGAGFSNAVVILGGRYSATDSYNTPVGILSGAMLHAGSFYSVNRPIGKTSHVVSYLLDILMGCILGLIIFKLASLYRNERSLASILMNLTIQPIFPYFMIVMAGILLARWNLWLNPAPMIFGMAIHAGLVRIEEPYVPDVSDRKLLGISERRIKQFIYCAVVLVAWRYLYLEINTVPAIY